MMLPWKQIVLLSITGCLAGKVFYTYCIWVSLHMLLWFMSVQNLSWESVISNVCSLLMFSFCRFSTPSQQCFFLIKHAYAFISLRGNNWTFVGNQRRFSDQTRLCWLSCSHYMYSAWAWCPSLLPGVVSLLHVFTTPSGTTGSPILFLFMACPDHYQDPCSESRLTFLHNLLATAPHSALVQPPGILTAEAQRLRMSTLVQMTL